LHRNQGDAPTDTCNQYILPFLNLGIYRHGSGVVVWGVLTKGL
jgi:hypothetical protein